MPPSAKHSSEWLVLHPSSIDEAPQCHPEANLAQVGCAQIPVRRSKVRLSPNRKLSSFHGAIGTAKSAWGTRSRLLPGDGQTGSIGRWSALADDFRTFL